MGAGIPTGIPPCSSIEARAEERELSIVSPESLKDLRESDLIEALKSEDEHSRSESRLASIEGRGTYIVFSTSSSLLVFVVVP